MIVCRKPWTLYDVDLAGIGGAAVLLLAGWWLVAAPWQALWREFHTFAAARTAEQAGLRADLVGLTEFEQSVTDLERVVLTQEGAVPTADTISQQLQKLTDLAAATDVELLSVTPQPVAAAGEYVVSDVQIGGKGRSHDFIRLLDRLAQENPYQSLRNCVISHSSPPDQAACELNWTMRMYLLPVVARRGGVP